MTPISTRALHQLLDQSASRFPDKVVVEEPESGSIRYGELARLSDRVRDRLRQMSVKPGDRVGICLRKSADAVASLFGITKAGARIRPRGSYRPRLAQRVYFARLCSQNPNRLGAAGGGATLGVQPSWLCSRNDRPRRGRSRSCATNALDRLDAVSPASSVPSVVSEPSHLAYIRYTSGSTGRPKGVMLLHGNAACFIDWCSDLFEPNKRDRFSSYAQFHFDLSILDIYVSLKHGATLVIVEEQSGKEPARLAAWIAQKKTGATVASIGPATSSPNFQTATTNSWDDVIA